MKRLVPGAIAEIKRLLIENPDMRPAELREILIKKGWGLSLILVSATRSEFRQTLRFLQDRGLLSRGLM
jgi:hypothetical protein